MTAAKNVLRSPITLKAGQRFTRSHRFDGGGVFANERLVTRVLWSDATGYFNEVVTSGG